MKQINNLDCRNKYNKNKTTKDSKEVSDITEYN